MKKNIGYTQADDAEELEAAIMQQLEDAGLLYDEEDENKEE